MRTKSLKPATTRWLGLSGGEAKTAALHADLQAVRRLAAGIEDAAVHVTRQVAVAALLRGAAAAEARVVAGAGAAGGAVQHDVAQREKLAEQAGQDAVNAAVWREEDTVNAMVTPNHSRKYPVPHRPAPRWESGSCCSWSCSCSSCCSGR